MKQNYDKNKQSILFLLSHIKGNKKPYTAGMLSKVVNIDKNFVEEFLDGLEKIDF